MGQKVGNNWRKRLIPEILDRDFYLRLSADYGNDVTMLMDTRERASAARRQTIQNRKRRRASYSGIYFPASENSRLKQLAESVSI